ncbi:MAG: response regulator [Myxococcales bacterium]|nr:response regulator [Myxococcales bacterium]
MGRARGGSGRAPGSLVLVADDRREYRETLSAFLRGAGYGVVTANDGSEALARVGDARPDLMLLDIVMPGMNGIDVCRTIKSDIGTQEIPIVMISSLTDPDEINEAMRAGAAEFMVKPVDRAELVALVEKLLAAPALQAA